MAYVRKKTTKTGKEFYQLVESRRVDGEPRQKVLVHLGKYPSVDAALERLPVLIDMATTGRGLDRWGSPSERVYEHEGHWIYKHKNRKPPEYLHTKLRTLKRLREEGKV